MLHFLLEPDALRGARPVLRGGGGSNAISLPDEDSSWNAGVGFRPSFALAFSPDDAGSLDYLKATLHVCGEVLRQIKLLLDTLEVMGCP